MLLSVESSKPTDDGPERSQLKNVLQNSSFSPLKFICSLREMDILKQAVIQSVGERLGKGVS